MEQDITSDSGSIRSSTMFILMKVFYSNMNDYLLYSSALALETGSIFIFGRYDPSHTSSAMGCPVWLSPSRGFRWEDCTQSQHSLVALVARCVNDPSPAAFIGALSTFTLAALYIHHFHQDDRYQNAFLVGSACGVILLSCAIHIILPDTRWLQSLQTYLPLAIVFGSSFSAVMHHLGILDRASSGHQEIGQENEKDKLRSEPDGKIFHEAGLLQ
ncbi:hypothetical protein ABVK25_009885 [Lepraria finkii]|uniref:Uncharacterized protein n=1 Tax=Lepraria finkii TaxID=1340010 RepID=A0ABR4AVV0_9LECA